MDALQEFLDRKVAEGRPMPDLANLDQALKMILAEVCEGWPTMIDGSSHDYYTGDQVLEAMRRAYRLGMSAEGLGRQFIKGGE